MPVCPEKAELEGCTSRQCSLSTTVLSISSCRAAQKQAHPSLRTECGLALDLLLEYLTCDLSFTLGYHLDSSGQFPALP